MKNIKRKYNPMVIQKKKKKLSRLVVLCYNGVCNQILS